MQDRFKFRFWDKEKREYFTCGELEKNAKYLTYPYRTYNLCFCDNSIISEPCIGIKDKNEKLIYEGDIVINLLNKESPYYQVKWDSEYLSYCFEAVGNSEDLDVEMPLEIVYEGYHEEKYQNGFYDIFEPSRTEIKYLEVIGNIHENPELLEVQDDKSRADIQP